MKLYYINLIVLLFIVITAIFCNAGKNGYIDSNDGFLNSTCTKAQDCYILDDVNKGLWLACWSNVKKCKCQNTINTNFNLKWENSQCLMSKYGPCGTKHGTITTTVGCQDNFTCIDNICRDPQNPKLIKSTPYIFKDSKCTNGGCIFSEDLLELECKRSSHHESGNCVCEMEYIADAKSPYWDIKNYDGNKNCSVGKFGPCGNKNGIIIECHGPPGITCINGTCLDVNHPISNINQNCATNKNCEDGLLCSPDNICIEPYSLVVGKTCNSVENQCQKGLVCKQRPNYGPWSSEFCQTESEANNGPKRQEEEN